MPAKKSSSKPQRPAKQKAGGGCPGATCSAGSPTFDEIVAARKMLCEKFDYPAGSEEIERSSAWMQWRRMRTTEDLNGYVWWLLENAIKMDSEMAPVADENDDFHGHLKRCRQCADHPFALCSTGERLIKRAAENLGQNAHGSSDHTESDNIKTQNIFNNN